MTKTNQFVISLNIYNPLKEVRVFVYVGGKEINSLSAEPAIAIKKQTAKQEREHCRSDGDEDIKKDGHECTHACERSRRGLSF